MTFFQFIRSKLFLWQLLLAVVAIIVILTGVTWSLSSYTRHGQTIQVPQLEGYTEAQIKDQIENLGLNYVIMDSMFRLDIKPGAIIDQYPKGGKKVKKGRKIFLTINAYSREMTPMPQLVDYSLRNAQVVIESVGLKVGNITYEPSDYNDLVLGQIVDGRPIKQGTKIPKGTTVDLVVGSGKGGKSVVVPEVIGFGVADAQNTLESVSLKLGALMYDESVLTPTDTATAIIFRQSPEAKNGAIERQGSTINVWLTTDMEKVVAALAASTTH